MNIVIERLSGFGFIDSIGSAAKCEVDWGRELLTVHSLNLEERFTGICLPPRFLAVNRHTCHANHTSERLTQMTDNGFGSKCGY
ncbi:MAG: hypothetical protein FJ295_06455 [Planctomycetes bacterium]|nr:hypothetical protein [Planctomycetota bacterium]